MNWVASLLSPAGHIGRWEYFSGLLLIALLWFASIGVMAVAGHSVGHASLHATLMSGVNMDFHVINVMTMTMLAYYVVVVLLAWSYLMLAVKRFRDMGFHGAFALLLVVPALNVLVVLWLLLHPTKKFMPRVKHFS